MNTDKTITQLIDQFTSELDVQDNSKHLYRRNVKAFYRWVQAANKEPYDLSRSDVIEYKKHILEECKHSLLTVDSYLTAVRRFYDWLELNDISSNIVAGIRNPKRYRGFRKDPLTSDQVNELLNSIDRSTFKGKRDYVMVILMVKCALRSVEISRLNYEDIDQQNDTYGLWVTGKGSAGNKVFVPITDNIYHHLEQFVVSKTDIGDGEPLFTTLAYSTRGARLSPKAIGTVVKHRIRKAGVKSKRVTAHSLRHTAAVLLIKKGASLYDVQLFLRHRSPNTTEIYTRMIEEEKRLSNIPGRMLDEMLA